jgi:hypothetical protein
VRCRSPHVAVPRVFKTRCRAVGDRSVFGVPSEIRTPSLPHRRRTLCSNELRERIFGPRPGNRTRAIYGDLPLRVYKAQPHASADAVFAAACIGQGGVIRICDLMRPRQRFRRAKLHPDGAPCGERSRLTGSTDRPPHLMRNGATQLVCTGRLERPPNAVSGQRLCRLGYVHVLVDTPGNDPGSD